MSSLIIFYKLFFDQKFYEQFVHQIFGLIFYENYVVKSTNTVCIYLVSVYLLRKIKIFMIFHRFSRCFFNFEL